MFVATFSLACTPIYCTFPFFTKTFPPSLIAAGFAINEGGNVFVKNGKVQYIGVQASEKVATNIAVIARGTSGHASQPTKDNPVLHLAAAVAKIGNYSAPVHFPAIVRRYFEGI